jgi:hypothetical protein
VCSFAGLFVGIDGVLMSRQRMLMGLSGVLVTFFVVALAVVLCGQVMVLGCFFVVVRGFLVRFVCHFEFSCGKSPGAILSAPL